MSPTSIVIVVVAGLFLVFLVAAMLMQGRLSERVENDQSRLPDAFRRRLRRRDDRR
jgi:hypothetical protein